MNSKALFVWTLVIGPMCTCTTSATFDDIVFWVGTGSNQAALVLDWNDSKAPEALVWGYRWDGTATGLEMLQAIVEADSRLFAHVSEPGPFGTAVYGIGYDLNGNGTFSVSPALQFNAGGWSVGNPDDYRSAVEEADRWAEGWYTGFWGYHVRSSSQEEWISASTGPGDRVLENGSWDGYSFAAGFNFTAPSEPVPAPVPEPRITLLMCTGGLALLGSLVLKNRKQKQRTQ